ncbi:phosphoglycerate mutase-like protein [Amylocystis lapponica]|nr:phosphoglycerate mutase-like protein [Amylocystis lapponica]
MVIHSPSTNCGAVVILGRCYSSRPTTTMSANSESTVLGIIVLARNGDHIEVSNLPVNSYSITSLGLQQEWQLGNLLRSLYLNASSPSYIQGIAPSTAVFNASQVQVSAIVSDEGSATVDSATALVQGLWPPTPFANTTLANGSTIVSPFDGYQYVPVTAVDSDVDVSLDGYTDCVALGEKSLAFQRSAEYRAMDDANDEFMTQLEPYIGNVRTSIMNTPWIYEQMSMQYIHNATYANALPPTFMAQVRALADWIEYNVYSDISSAGIGNVAFRSMLPGVLSALEEIAAGGALKMSYNAISYQPFLSLFNMTGVVSNDGVSPAIVDHAAAAVLEVRKTSTSQPFVRFQFKNGTQDGAFATYPMTLPDGSGSLTGDIPVAYFTSALQSAALDPLEWCYTCEQTVVRGCSRLIAEMAPPPRSLSRAGSDAITVAVTVVVLGSVLALLVFFRVIMVSTGKGQQKRVPGGMQRIVSVGTSEKGVVGDRQELLDQGNSPEKN